MSSQNGKSVQPAQEHVPLHVEEPCLTKRTVIITSIALIALLIVAAGVLSMAAHYISSCPTYIKGFAYIPAWGAGILMGGGGVILTGDVGHAIYTWLKGRDSLPPPDRVTITIPVGVPLQPEEEEVVVEEIQLPPPEDPLPVVKRVRTSLTYAMRLFKNFDQGLAQSYSELSLLSDFMGKISVCLPQGRYPTDQLNALIERQSALETNGEENGPAQGLASLFHTALRHHDPEGGQISKKIYQINLLNTVLNDYPEWREDRLFRAWVASTLVLLRKHLPQTCP